MRPLLVLVVSFAVQALGGLTSREARATGGLLVTEGDVATTAARAHRVVLSISDERTSLWDDLAYTGSPSDLAWILPVQGPAEIAESSVYLQQHLDGMTEVTVEASFCCPDFLHCQTTLTGSEPHGAPIADHPVAEPYETVRVASADVGALAAWMEAGGYVVTDDVAAVLDDYAARGFDFLAVRFAPTDGVADTRPLRVTMPGRHPVLPIPMLQAGAGDVIDTTLWVVSDTFHLPPTWFVVEGSDLIWNWDTRTSDYDEVVAAKRAAAGEDAWLLEGLARPYHPDMDAVATETAGYRGTVEARAAAAEADREALIGPLVAEDQWIHVTRLRAPPSPGAGSTDLELVATEIASFEPLLAEGRAGAWPCPPRPPSSGAGAGPGDGAGGGAGGAEAGEGGGDEGHPATPLASGDDGGCNLGGAPSARGGAAASALALLVTLAMCGRRRRARARARGPIITPTPSRGAASRGRSPAAARCGRRSSGAPARGVRRGARPRSS